MLLVKTWRLRCKGGEGAQTVMVKNIACQCNGFLHNGQHTTSLDCWSQTHCSQYKYSCLIVATATCSLSEDVCHPARLLMFVPLSCKPLSWFFLKYSGENIRSFGYGLAQAHVLWFIGLDGRLSRYRLLQLSRARGKLRQKVCIPCTCFTSLHSADVYATEVLPA